MVEIDRAVQFELDALELVKPIDEVTERGDSDIQQFYRDKTLFLTGTTGFIGKQLLEKLFRSCEIKKAFVLIRPKNGAPTKERLREMLNDPVFEPVRKKKPDMDSRIVCVEGDVAELRLGIRSTDWNTIVDEVDIIFHVAATVRFDEPIRMATLINVRGTREALALGKACKKLKSFVHVSTAYCHTTSSRTGGEVLEQFYKSPLPPDTMLNMAETVSNETLENISSSLTSGWPNTYTFTKAISEELVQAESKNLPICIVRPSIVLSSYREPLPGWLDMSCVYGPSGIVLGIGLGIVRVLMVDNKAKISFVPVDFVNNATIAAGWETALKKNEDTKLYNVSSTNCAITFRHISSPMSNSENRKTVCASLKSIWYPFLIETNKTFVYWLLSWFLHYIPAYIVDGAMNVFDIKKPQGLKSFIKVYSKFDKMNSLYSYFLTNEWIFDDTNLKSLWQRMSDADKTIYNFDIKTIDWDHMTCMWVLGVRKYIVKDGLKDTDKANTRNKWLKFASYLVLLVYLFIIWNIISWVCYVF